MALKFRLDLGLGSQPLKLAALITLVWGALCLFVLQDRLTGPMDDTTADMLVLLAVPPVVVLACAWLVRWLGTGPR